MLTFARIAIAGALILVVAVLGYNLLPGRTGDAIPGSSPTPSATDEQPVGPTSGPSSIPTPDQASERPAATPSVTPTASGEIDHPTGARDVILRMETDATSVPLGFLVAPSFSLYGDGTFIVRWFEDPEQRTPDLELPRFLQGRLENDSLQTLLAFALADGRLAEAREDYPQDSCEDCPTTVFTLDAGGQHKVVTVGGLGIAEVPADAVDRAGFEQLAELLEDFEGKALGGELGDVVLYDAGHYRLTLMEAFDEPATEPIEWPWVDLTPDDFRPATELGEPQAIVTRARVALLTDLPSGGHRGVPVLYEDKLRLIGVRPLLPDDATAP